MAFYIFDIDGTLANGDHREHFVTSVPMQWDTFFEACDQDLAHEHILHICRLLMQSPTDYVEFWTGRPEKVRGKTVQWLIDHRVLRSNILPILPNTYRLRMRPDSNKDYSPSGDVRLKRGWLKLVRETYHQQIAMVFEDRHAVVQMWRDEGVPCAQVAEGKF